MKNIEQNLGSSLLERPQKFVNDLLVERRLKNPRYSASALARDLGISQGYLSQVMTGVRQFSLEQKMKIASHLGLSLELSTTLEKKTKLHLIESSIEHEKIIKHWYHFAIMELTKTTKLKNNPRLIGKRLGVSVFEAKLAIERLIDFGYLGCNSKNELVKTKTPFLIRADTSALAIREYHQSRLTAAGEALNLNDGNSARSRFYQTMFLPTSREKVSEAKKMILQFQEKLVQFLTSDQPNEVFQIGVQIFSAEKPTTLKKEKL